MKRACGAEQLPDSGHEPNAASSAAPRWLTWSNGLSALRLLAALPLAWAIMAHSWRVACILFWLAVASDWVDGRLARARGESSALGALLDHGSDATLVVFGLVALAAAGQTPWVLPCLVGAAFLQYVLDSRALVGCQLRASALGRWNGILYFVPIGIIVTRESLGMDFPADAQVVWLGWGLLLSTCVSIGDRAWAIVMSRGPSSSSS
ncbi:MAG: CDP-alcohol phosphatidyltransferase family protein [Deltaproteobacteria bacterium]|nr:CDP-alcohol phosphatidyltransferase family protein [Deltaproteobacteria bacterium]